MLSAHLPDMELVEETSGLDPTHSLRFGFALSGAEGTASTTVVYFEIEPGRRLGRHADSAEEVLLVLEGEVEAVVGDERARLRPGGVAVVPARVPHEVRNAGDATARIAGVFSSAAVVSTFDEPAVEGGETVFVAGAPVPLAA